MADRFGCGRIIFAVAALGLLAVVSLGVQQARGQAVGLCETLVQPWGYPCTEYTVETEDGYLLGVQHIPNGVNQGSGSATRPPVFLQHGVFAGGDNWVFNEPSESLGFILADAGFDVWIGNIRGIMWSHGHVNLTVDDSEFWNWSWDELAAYDLPAMLQFVHNQTGSEILYVGHSQGTAMMMAGLVGTAQSEAMTNMLAGVVLVCPIAFMGNITSKFDQIAADMYADKILDVFGAQEFSYHNQLGQDLIHDVCETDGLNCTNLFEAVSGTDCCMNETRVPFYLNFYPQPTSSYNVAHFAQMIRKDTFSMYDFGAVGNLDHYEQLTPPVYDVASFPDSVPLMIVNGGQDSLADPIDVEYLISVLGSKVTKTVTVDRYAHKDFVMSFSANVDVYPQIVQFLQNPAAEQSGKDVHHLNL